MTFSEDVALGVYLQFSVCVSIIIIMDEAMMICTWFG